MYINLHTHTEYSNISAGLDSINRIDDLVSRAQELGLAGLAITDHENLSNIVAVNHKQKELKEKGIDFKLIQGNEIYLIDDFDNEEKGRKYFHFLLLAKDRIGLDVLIKLSSRAWYRSKTQNGRRRIPTLKSDLEEIITPEISKHLFAATACLGGELATRLLGKEGAAADEFIVFCKKIFGEGFFIELQSSLIPEQIEFNKLAASRWPNEQFIITTDAHYQNKEDFAIFEAFLRSAQEGREVKEYYEFARLQSEEEIKELMNYLSPEFVNAALSNTLKIGGEIQDYDLSQKINVPKVKILQEEIPQLEAIPVQDLADFVCLKKALEATDHQTAFCVRYSLLNLFRRNLWTRKYLERLEEEFEVFFFQSEQLESNMFAYFNTLHYYLKLAWEIDCAVGPSRGSSSGSLICYLMDIVQCDPIQYNLPFFRFANKERVSILDIDIDLQPSRRPALFEKIREERGELGLVQIATFRTLTLKSAIGSAGRGYRSKEFSRGLDPDLIGYLSSLVEIKRGFVATLDQSFRGGAELGFQVNNSFIKELKKYEGLIDILRKIEGLIVGSSTHAAGILLFDEEDKLENHCSLMRSPNGDLCSALDLHTVEETGVIKYDFLLLSTLDIQATCFKLLQKDKVIDSNLTLKECFRAFINPNKIDFENPRIWGSLHNNKVLSIFQWDTTIAQKGLFSTRPQSLIELTILNGLIRLTTQRGEEDQIKRFLRLKEDLFAFEQEMIDLGVAEEKRQIMHEELDKYGGVCVMQESFMILVQRLAGYTLKEADIVRKIVAKKEPEKVSEQKKFFFEKLGDIDIKTKEYLWSVIIAPSLGYAFSYLHSLPYTMIGIQCILLGAVLFPPIYWQAACLLQRSGALDDKAPNYNKISKACSLLLKQGVNIRPLDINKSERNFQLDAAENTIYFGFAAAKGIKEKVIDSILYERPFVSISDFMGRVNPDVTSLVGLVKGGAFDCFLPRGEAIDYVCGRKAEKKEKLNGQNLALINRSNLWPPELKESQRIFNFNKYTKGKGFELDERSIEFLDELGFPHNGEKLDRISWGNFYDFNMKEIKRYLIENQAEMLEKVNKLAKEDWRHKYFPGENLSSWEIEILGICFEGHPLKDISRGISNFDDLPPEPLVNHILTTNQGRTFPIYELSMICGVAIAKDKLHHSVTILTSESGPVEVKFRKEQFSSYDKQVSKTLEDGKKKVVESSWFNRGNMLLIHGLRQGDGFQAKVYKNSPMRHTVYKIIGFKEDGRLEVQEGRREI